MRPRQWIKNLVVFAALIFAKKLTDTQLILRSMAAFGLFCATSGGVYIINDLFDADRDRKHPHKARRPIASRALGTLPALTAAILLLAGSVMTGFILSGPFGAVLLIYVVINLVYSFWLKEVVIIDVMAIASGFVLRAVAGAMIIGVEISHWLIMCTILLSLFLALCKRRQELESLERAHEHRIILKEYSLDYIDQMINVVTPSTLLMRSEEHTSELQSQSNLVCRLLLEKKKTHTAGSDRSPERSTREGAATCEGDCPFIWDEARIATYPRLSCSLTDVRLRRSRSNATGR